jgi:hypothetical protein
LTFYHVYIHEFHCVFWAVLASCTRRLSDLDGEVDPAAGTSLGDLELELRFELADAVEPLAGDTPKRQKKPKGLGALWFDAFAVDALEPPVID